jgi:hypothetical protein
LAVFQFNIEPDRDLPRKPELHFADGATPIPYDTLRSLVEDVYRLWIEVLLERRDAVRSGRTRPKPTSVEKEGQQRFKWG